MSSETFHSILNVVGFSIIVLGVIILYEAFYFSDSNRVKYSAFIVIVVGVVLVIVSNFQIT